MHSLFGNRSSGQAWDFCCIWLLCATLSYPVVAEVTLETEDQDTGKPVRNAYTLVAPAGESAFISPLTTMVQVSYESNPDMTLDEAYASVKEMMDMAESDVDLFSDYVEGKNSGDATAGDYAKLHNIAQLSARLMGSNISNMETEAAALGETVEEVKNEILRIAVKEIMKSMDLIEDTATEDTDFDADQQVQALDIQVDTTDVTEQIDTEAAAMTYDLPSVRWAAVFRDYSADTAMVDLLALGLEHAVDLDAGWVFSVEGPNDFAYTFINSDENSGGNLYSDPGGAIAWRKWYLTPLPEGEYTFYVTTPGGDKLKVGSDTHVHNTIPAYSLDSVRVVNVSEDAGWSRLYHDTLDGNYFYCIMIRESATGEFVYRNFRKNVNIQYFPAQYSTTDYEYRIEVWDRPLIDKLTVRYRTSWAPINPSGETTDTFVAYSKGYRRTAYAADGVTTTTASDRLVLQIAIVNPTNIQGLTLTGPDDAVIYTYDLSLEPGETSFSSPYLFARYAGTTLTGAAYADYFLMIYGLPDSGVYTWNVDVDEGDDFTHSVTVYDKTALPCVDPTSITVTEDDYNDITFEWDAVTLTGKPLFYQVLISNSATGSYFAPVHVFNSRFIANRAKIEAAIGSILEADDVTYTILVMDSWYRITVHNRTDFAAIPLVIE